MQSRAQQEPSNTCDNIFFPFPAVYATSDAQVPAYPHAPLRYSSAQRRTCTAPTRIPVSLLLSAVNSCRFTNCPIASGMHPVQAHSNEIRLKRAFCLKIKRECEAQAVMGCLICSAQLAQGCKLQASRKGCWAVCTHSISTVGEWHALKSIAHTESLAHMIRGERPQLSSSACCANAEVGQCNAQKPDAELP